MQSVGNFDVGPVATAVDLARLALAPAVGAAAERAIKLLQAPWSGLAPGLAANPQRGDDGLAELAVAVQAIAVEARSLAHPVSTELVSTTNAEGIEDRTTMAPLAARRLDEMIGLAARVVAIELVVAAQAIDLRHAAPLGTGTAAAYSSLGALAPFTGTNETLPTDLETVVDLVNRGL